MWKLSRASNGKGELDKINFTADGYPYMLQIEPKKGSMANVVFFHQCALFIQKGI